jgi:hypothetical protein
MFRIGAVIVIAEDGPKAVRRGHLAQQASTWFSRDCSLLMIADPGQGDKVTEKHDQVGTKSVDNGNGGMERVNRKVRVVVEIADQCDGKAVQPFGPTRQKKILANDVRAVGLQQDSVSGKSNGSGGGGSPEKLPSCGNCFQKLKLACRSMRRTATPVENGPP